MNAKSSNSKRRSRMSYEEMGIPVGSELVWILDPSIVVVVRSAHEVALDGHVTSSTAATKHLLGVSSYPGLGTRWTFRGATLDAVDDATCGPVDR